MPLASVNSTYTDIVTSVFSSAIAAKVWFASIAIGFALAQIVTASRIYGKLGRALRSSYFGVPIGRIHRWSGRLAFLFTLPVAFHCIFILGFQTANTRVLAHSLLGTFLYGVFAVKVLVVRDHSLPGWVLPVAGSSLFTALVALWSTSSLWYFTNIRFGF